MLSQQEYFMSWQLSVLRKAMVWLFQAFTKAAAITEPIGVNSSRSKAILKGLTCREEEQSLKANLWETDWKSKSWNQSALFYSQDGELE